MALGRKSRDHTAFLERYREAAEEVDKTLLEEWGSDLDSLLVFAGLFSAVLTAFIVESYKLLQPDFAQLTYYALRNTSGPYTPETFTVPSSARTVNGLWIASLTLSLLSALIMIVAKQWLMNYAVLNRGSLYDWVMLRQYHYDGTVRWRLTEFFALLPALLHLALFLFLIGLVVFFFGIDPHIARLTLGLVIVVVVLYVAAVCTPFFWHSSPFRTMLCIIIRDVYFDIVEALYPGRGLREDPWHRLPTTMEPQCFEAAMNWLSAWTDSRACMDTIIDALDYNQANITVSSPRLLDEIYASVDAALDRVHSIDYVVEDRLPTYIRVGRTQLSSESMLKLLDEHEVPRILNTVSLHNIDLAADVLSEVVTSLHTIKSRSDGTACALAPLVHKLMFPVGLGSTKYAPMGSNPFSTLSAVVLRLLTDAEGQLRDLHQITRMFSDVFSLREIDSSHASWTAFAHDINEALTQDLTAVLQAKDGYTEFMTSLKNFYDEIGFDPTPPTPPPTQMPTPALTQMPTPALTQTPTPALQP